MILCLDDCLHFFEPLINSEECNMIRGGSHLEIRAKLTTDKQVTGYIYRIIIVYRKLTCTDMRHSALADVDRQTSERQVYVASAHIDAPDMWRDQDILDNVSKLLRH